MKVYHGWLQLWLNGGSEVGKAGGGKKNNGGVSQ